MRGRISHRNRQMLTIKTPLSLNSWLPSHQLLLSGKLQYCKPDPTRHRDEDLVAKSKVKNKRAVAQTHRLPFDRLRAKGGALKSCDFSVRAELVEA